MGSSDCQCPGCGASGMLQTYSCCTAVRAQASISPPQANLHLAASHRRSVAVHCTAALSGRPPKRYNTWRALHISALSRPSVADMALKAPSASCKFMCQLSHLSLLSSCTRMQVRCNSKGGAALQCCRCVITKTSSIGTAEMIAG